MTESSAGSGAIRSLSAVTLGTHDMGRSVRFYRALGFELRYGGEAAEFSSFSAGGSYLNVVRAGAETRLGWWGRAIFYVDDVDTRYRAALAAGLRPQAEPRDAEWGERYFHITDPDGHEISLARPIREG